MARKLGIKGDPLAAPLEAPSVLDGILDRNRERAGRSAPEPPTTGPLAEPAPAPPIERQIDSYLDSKQDSKIESNPSPQETTEAPLIDRVTVASTARRPALVQLGVRIPAELKDRLEEAQIRLRKKGITNQGIVIAALELALTDLEEEIELL